MQRVPRYVVRTYPLVGPSRAVRFGVWDMARGQWVTWKQDSALNVYQKSTLDESEAGAVAYRKNAEAEAQIEQAIV